MTLKESIEKVKKATVQIIVTPRNGKKSSGSGFFIKENFILTCAHVAFGSEGPEFEKSLVALKDNIEGIKSLFAQRIIKIEIATEDRQILGEAELDGYDIEHDAVILALKTVKSSVVVSYDSSANLKLGEKVAFCGYPKVSQSEDPLTYSFMLNEGIISGFPSNNVGGFPQYEHIQVNAMSIGGFSGSPLFLEETGTIVGLINGNSNIGIKAAIVMPETNLLKNQIVNVPLGIAYATSLATITKLIKPYTDRDRLVDSPGQSPKNP
jgi:S1-C subfamily serine protease